MTEAVNYSEQYEILSPIERNGELKKLTEQLPLSDESENLDGAMGLFRFTERAGRRKRSVHWGILEQRLKSLLSFAYITPSFITFIEDGLRLKYMMGIEKLAQPKDEWFIDQDGAGIFDPARTHEFDRKGYRIMAANSLAVYSALTDQARSFGLEGDASDHFADVLNTPALKEVFEKTRKWRQEFIERYRQEP